MLFEGEQRIAEGECPYCRAPKMPPKIEIGIAKGDLKFEVRRSDISLTTDSLLAFEGRRQVVLCGHDNDDQ